MSLLLNELMGRLKREDEITLLELLNIDSEMLVERFSDIIEDKFELLVEEIEEGDE